jgi:hypothetical protein
MLDDIGAVNDEIRSIVARNWPHLLSKLPLEEDCPMGLQATINGANRPRRTRSNDFGVPGSRRKLRP